MRILNAIIYFEDAIKESDETIEDCSEKLKASLIEQKEHFIVALEALEKQFPKVPILDEEGLLCPNCSKPTCSFDWCFSCGQRLAE